MSRAATYSVGHRRRAQGTLASIGDVPTPVLLLILSFCLPTEVSLQAGPLRLTPCRVILLVSFVPCLMHLLSCKRPLNGLDGLMLMHGVWAIIALTFSMGAAQAVETGGIYMVETAGAYLLARRYVTKLEHVEAIARLTVTIICILCFAALIESITAVHFLRDIFKAILGGPGAHDMDQRMGLERAFTSFEHPILFGTFAASGFAMAYYILGQSSIQFPALVRLGLVGLACFLSMSGGPFVCLGFQGLLIGWDRVTKGISLRWAALAGIFALIWTMLSLASNRSPVLLFVSYLTFSAQSSYNRVNIWIYGTAEVGRHPLFGIGLNDWIRAPWMSDSMDTFWLLTTVRYGLPATIFLLATMIVIGLALNIRRDQSPRFKAVVKAWMVTMAGLSLGALTVHLWNAIMMQFFFLIGMGAAMTRLPVQQISDQVIQRMPTARPKHQQRVEPWI